MKFGVRKPSISKRIAARTSLKRYARHSLGIKAPRGWGWATNPRKATYNRVYRRTTIGIEDLGRMGRRPTSHKNTGVRHASRTQSESLSCGRVLACIFVPPLAVVDKGCGSTLLVTLLTLLFWIPGVLAALVICSQDRQKGPQSTDAQRGPVSQIPSPGASAPKYEKEIVKGFNYYLQNRMDKALPHFLAASSRDACAAIFAGSVLSKRESTKAQAISLLENVVKSHARFPTPMMTKYMEAAYIQAEIADGIDVTVPMDRVAAILLLAVLYDERGFTDRAIALLEAENAVIPDPTITLSLCHMYGEKGLWNRVIQCAAGTESRDDVTLGTMILHGRALQKIGLHDGAISVYTAALGRRKDRNPALLREAKYWRAISYEAVGRQAEANKSLQEVYAEAPDYRDVESSVLNTRCQACGAANAPRNNFCNKCGAPL